MASSSNRFVDTDGESSFEEVVVLKVEGFEEDSVVPRDELVRVREDYGLLAELWVIDDCPLDSPPNGLAAILEIASLQMTANSYLYLLGMYIAFQMVGLGKVKVTELVHMNASLKIRPVSFSKEVEPEAF
ncbi:hypothetical protein Patl1_02630 [Pistacia atlantica]|uniref:Uncharacterized protein n=1 Tax=Pistacia atlantica TaxID=434234 RepID=A0ACC1CE05_9ROSI|nr:hypothetical protein Patl1_02630 [Pistacia atlantica]